MPILEVCVDSFESAKAAISGGAHRLEICSALSEGGLTPSHGLVRTVRNSYRSATIFVMLRPTNKINYEITDDDMKQILVDMDMFDHSSVDGFVFGALKKDRKIDIEHCKLVIEKAREFPVTFHRAIDMTDPAQMYNNLNIIQHLGYKRILSSGYAETALKGIDKLKDMCRFMINTPITMPGCGINDDNVDDILRAFPWAEFHASARVKHMPKVREDDSDYQRTCLQNNPIYITNEDIVRRLVKSGERWHFRH